MGLTAKQIKHSLDSLAGQEKRFAIALEQAGYPEPRIRERGYTTLLRTIVGQQVSVAAASSMWNKLAAKLGEDCAPDKLLARLAQHAECLGLDAAGMACIAVTQAGRRHELFLNGPAQGG